MQLKEDVACVGEQCAVGSVRIVKVDVGYFEYVPPTCVHMFFYDGRVVASADKYFATKRTCENPDVRIAGASCCAGRKDDAPAVVAKPCQEWTGTATRSPCASVRLSPVEPATNRGPIRQSWWSLWPAVRIHSTCWCR